MNDLWPQEADLVGRAQRGDQAAYGELVMRYQRLVAVVALRLGADSSLAQDIAQEAFLRAWRNLPRFQPRGQASFRAWLCRIAHNLTVDARRCQPPDPSPLEESQVDTAAGHDPAAAYVRDEQAQRVRAAIRQLPQACQETLILREYGELSYQEIAHVLDIPAGTVMSRLNYARTRLRALLQEQADGTH